jgi:hypothetical protein
MAIVIRKSSLDLVVLSIWQLIPVDLMFLKRNDMLKDVVSKYCVQKLSNVNGDNLDELDPHLAKHQ